MQIVESSDFFLIFVKENIIYLSLLRWIINVFQ